MTGETLPAGKLTPPPVCGTCGRERCRWKRHIPLTVPKWLADAEEHERERRKRVAAEKKTEETK